MFKENKYTKWYNQLIEYRLINPCGESYTEKHHIIPKSMGGDNNETNIVILSVREHIFCHKLLPYMTKNSKHKGKMMYALLRIYYGNKEQIKYSSKFTAKLVNQLKENHRQLVSKLMTNRIVSAETKEKLSKSHKGKKKTEAHKKALSIAKIGKPAPKPKGFGETIRKIKIGVPCPHTIITNKNPEKIRKTANTHRGMKRSTQAKKNMSISKTEYIKSNNGPSNKGHKQYYNPNNIKEKIQCLPCKAPIGWINGNPLTKGKSPFFNIYTQKIKKFNKQEQPLLSNKWVKYNPNNKDHLKYV